MLIIAWITFTLSSTLRDSWCPDATYRSQAVPILPHTAHWEMDRLHFPFLQSLSFYLSIHRPFHSPIHLSFCSLLHNSVHIRLNLYLTIFLSLFLPTHHSSIPLAIIALMFYLSTQKNVQILSFFLSIHSCFNSPTHPHVTSHLYAVFILLFYAYIVLSFYAFFISSIYPLWLSERATINLTT